MKTWKCKDCGCEQADFLNHGGVAHGLCYPCYVAADPNEPARQEAIRRFARTAEAKRVYGESIEEDIHDSFIVD